MAPECKLYTSVRQHARNENYTVFQKKIGPFVISSYLCFDSYELCEHFKMLLYRRYCLLWIWNKCLWRISYSLLMTL